MLPGRLLPSISALLLLAAAACGGDSPASDAHVITIFDAPPPFDAAPGRDSASFDDVCPVVDYQACGGELAGAWYFGALCPNDLADIPCENPFGQEPSCSSSGNTHSCVLHTVGSLTFEGTSVHVVRSFTVEPTYVFTGPCLAAVQPNQPDTASRCAALSDPPALDCAVTAETCTCTGTSSPDETDETVGFTTAGNAITIAGELTGSYCADGDKLTLDFDPHPASWRYWVLTR